MGLLVFLFGDDDIGARKVFSLGRLDAWCRDEEAGVCNAFLGAFAAPRALPVSQYPNRCNEGDAPILGGRCLQRQEHLL